MAPREPKRARKSRPATGAGDHLEIDYNAIAADAGAGDLDGSSEDSNAGGVDAGRAAAAPAAPAAPAPAADPLDNEVLAERCGAYVELNRKIKELASQMTALRKTLKTQEKDLLLIMQTIKLEEIDVDGVKITRIKRLQITDE